MKWKRIIISLVLLFLILIGLKTYNLHLASESFSTLDGIKAVTTLWMGEDVVELTSYKLETVLMAKSTDVGNDAIISELEKRGYKINDRIGSILMCEKNGESSDIKVEAYTRDYIIYILW